VRAIARRLSMARKTVRKLLGQRLPERKELAAPARPRCFDRFAPQIQAWLKDARKLSAPAMLERRARSATAVG